LVDRVEGGYRMQLMDIKKGLVYGWRLRSNRTALSGRVASVNKGLEVLWTEGGISVYKKYNKDNSEYR
jgi:hypothetical protein